MSVSLAIIAISTTLNLAQIQELYCPQLEQAEAYLSHLKDPTSEETLTLNEVRVEKQNLNCSTTKTGQGTSR